MKGERKDLENGQRFNQWIVISFSHKNHHYQYFWHCQCSCGYKSVVEQSRLINARSTKCKICANALRRKYKSIVLNQQQYGRWIILREDEMDKRFVFVQCDCGNTKRIIKEILLKEQISGCGICKVKLVVTKHGHNKKNKTTPEYHAWRNAKTRVFNSKFKGYSRYGGRGIKMAPEWTNSFDHFLHDVGFRPSLIHSLDRIDNDGNYELGNVRWALPIEQVRNREMTFKVDGEYIDLKKLGSELKVHPRTIKKLILKVGFSIKDIQDYSQLTSYQKTEMGKSINSEKPYSLLQLKTLQSSLPPSKKRHELWNVWHSMRQRCNNSKNRDYDNYGARGIQVCDEWATFVGFLNSILSCIGNRPSVHYQLDRIDNNGNYESENIRWSTVEEQARNKRTSLYLNDIIDLSIKKLLLKYKISRVVIIKLIGLGWNEEGLEFFEQLNFKQKKYLKIFVDQLSHDVAMQKLKDWLIL